MIGNRMLVAVAVTACTGPSAINRTSALAAHQDDQIAVALAQYETISDKRFGPPVATSEPWPWKIGQWVVYKRRHRNALAIERLSIVAQDVCGFWFEYRIDEDEHHRSWQFCMSAPPAPDDTRPFALLWAVVARRDGRVLFVSDFRRSSDDREQYAWLVSLVHASWPEHEELPREDIATSAGHFEGSYKLTSRIENVEVTRWSHPAVFFGGIVKEVSDVDEKVLLGQGMSNGPRPLLDAAAEQATLQAQALEAAARQRAELPPRGPSGCLDGGASSTACETSPRKFASVSLGPGGVSRNGDVPPTAGWTWKFQFGQRLADGLHLVEEFNSFGSHALSPYPTDTSEEHSSFGAGVRWTPFQPGLNPSPPFPTPVPGRYVDIRAFYLTAVIGANMRSRFTTPASTTDTAEDTAWSPMASLAVGLLEIQGRDFSIGPEFREQLARYDGRLQRGWQLSLSVHLNEW